MSATRLPGSGGTGLHALAWEGPSRVAPPYLLVHGLASNCRTWEAVADRLASRGHPVAAVDLRGHGRSDKPEGGYDFATLAADLVAALDGLGWGRAVVAGQSTGGNLAVEVAWRWPERVAGVAGIDGGVLEPWRQWPAWEDCRRALAPPVLTGVPAAEVEARIRAEHPGWEDEAVVATMANLEVLPDGTVRPWLAREHHLCILRALWEHRPSTLVAGLPVPVLLVLAGGGSDGGPSVEEARRNPLVRVEWLEGSHDLHVERPDDVALLLAGMAAS